MIVKKMRKPSVAHFSRYSKGWRRTQCHRTPHGGGWHFGAKFGEGQLKRISEMTILFLWCNKPFLILVENMLRSNFGHLSRYPIRWRPTQCQRISQSCGWHFWAKFNLEQELWIYNMTILFLWCNKPLLIIVVKKWRPSFAHLSRYPMGWRPTQFHRTSQGCGWYFWAKFGQRW